MDVNRARTGKNRAVDAAKSLNSPLLDVTIDGSKGVLFNVVGGSDLSLYEVNEAAEVIKQAVVPMPTLSSVWLQTRVWAAMSDYLITTGLLPRRVLRFS